MRRLLHDHALVLFSGGQDSAITLAWALEKYNKVETIGFDYGQRHAVELETRGVLRELIKNQSADWSVKLGGDRMVDLSSLNNLTDTSLTAEKSFADAPDGLPNSFVPGRNLLFFVYAAVEAYRSGAGILVGGMCETDYSGYPDCRADTLAAQLQALNLGMETDFEIQTPLMGLSKAQSWALAEQLGGRILVDLINEHSHTCYQGERTVRHDWGYGCSLCPACVLRAKGWREYEEQRSA